MMTEERLKLLEACCLGRLDKHQTEELQRRISADKELRQDYQLVQKIILDLRSDRREGIKKYIAKNAVSALTGNIWGTWWTKASIAIILLTGILIYISKQKEQEALIKPQKTEQKPTPIDSLISK